MTVKVEKIRLSEWIWMQTLTHPSNSAAGNSNANHHGKWRKMNHKTVNNAWLDLWGIGINHTLFGVVYTPIQPFSYKKFRISGKCKIVLMKNVLAFRIPNLLKNCSSSWTKEQFFSRVWTVFSIFWPCRPSYQRINRCCIKLWRWGKHSKTAAAASSFLVDDVWEICAKQVVVGS